MVLGVEVFALVYLQIGLLCLQIVIIAAPVAVSNIDSVLVLDRKMQGIKWFASSSLLHRPRLATCPSSNYHLVFHPL